MKRKSKTSSKPFSAMPSKCPAVCNAWDGYNFSRGSAFSLCESTPRPHWPPTITVYCPPILIRPSSVRPEISRATYSAGTTPSPSDSHSFLPRSPRKPAENSCTLLLCFRADSAFWGSIFYRSIISFSAWSESGSLGPAFYPCRTPC